MISIRQLAYFLLSALLVLQGSATKDIRNGLDAFRGGSAVRSPSKSVLGKKDRLERRGKQVHKQVTTQQQNQKKKISQVSSASPKRRFPLSDHKDALMGILLLTAVERGINKFFQSNAIKFPSQLAGCIALFFFFLLADVIRPGLGESMYTNLVPGSNLLAKWFPVLFVPGLVMLPLAPSIGNGVEVRTKSAITANWCSFWGLSPHPCSLLVDCQIHFRRGRWFSLLHGDHCLCCPFPAICTG